MSLIDETAYDEGKLSSIRNPDGIWINSQVFREEALNFLKKGYYIPDPWGSPAWYDYWEEQRRRCMYGYKVGGVKITGEHYFYLNFLQIKKTENPDNPKSRKVIAFPDFWDGDFNYFWTRQIAKEGIVESLLDTEEEKNKILSLDDIEQIPHLVNLFNSLKLEVKIPSHIMVKDEKGEQSVKHYLKGGFNIIVGKSRRKGYSYKSAAIATNNYFTKPDSYTIFAAYEKKYLYPKGIFTMAKNNIDFINSNTAWAMPAEFIDRQGHIRASYEEVKNGVRIEKGFKSEIEGLTFKDNSDAARGRDAEDIFFEESGAFGTPGLLKKSYKATEDCVMDGVIKTGMITIFGTSGDMEGGTADYADMFNRPEAFGLLPVYNIWDKDMQETTCGIFHPINWNLPGFYDEQGNSNFELAKKIELNERKVLIDNGATSTEIAQRLQEKPLGPKEAFSTVSMNTFPVAELNNRLHEVKSKGLDLIMGTPVELIRKNGKIVAEPILDGKKEPIRSVHNLPADKRGCVVIYERPVADAPKGLYKIGYDPIRQESGTSLAGMIVQKGLHKETKDYNNIVAEYIGRRESPDEIDKISSYLAEYYSTKTMHENEVTGVKNYYRRNKILHLLASQPDKVISKNVQNSKVARVYGCHMNVQLKEAGERYTNEWLNTVLYYDENGNPVRVLDKIYSRRLLEELIGYHRKGNFDLVSALFMCLIQAQEEALDKEYTSKEEKENKIAEELLDMINSMYKN